MNAHNTQLTLSPIFDRPDWEKTKATVTYIVEASFEDYSNQRVMQFFCQEACSLAPVLFFAAAYDHLPKKHLARWIYRCTDITTHQEVAEIIEKCEIPEALERWERFRNKEAMMISDISATIESSVRDLLQEEITHEMDTKIFLDLLHQSIL